jgi:hypothetical protein
MEDKQEVEVLNWRRLEGLTGGLGNARARN